MFGYHAVYHMVPLCLAIGVFCPLPFILGVSPLSSAPYSPQLYLC